LPYEIRTRGRERTWVRQIDRPVDLNAGGLADGGPGGGEARSAE